MAKETHAHNSNPNVQPPHVPSRVFKVTGTVSGLSVETLISCGSTHNFIHPDMVEKLGLEVMTTKPFRVYLSNGASISCNEKCDHTKLLIQGHEIVVDLFVLHIHSSEVVLGVQWLRSLGDVIENYADLRLRGDMNAREMSCYAMQASFD